MRPTLVYLATIAVLLFTACDDGDVVDASARPRKGESVEIGIVEKLTGIAYIQHGEPYNRDGKPLAIDVETIVEAQQALIPLVRAELDQNELVVFDDMLGTLHALQLEGTAAMIADDQVLGWAREQLDAKSDLRRASGEIGIVARSLPAYRSTLLEHDTLTDAVIDAGLLDFDPRVPPEGPGRHAAYVESCAAEGVPIPPDWPLSEEEGG